MKIKIKALDQTEIVDYESDVVPRRGEYVAIPPNGERVLVKYVVHHPWAARVALYVEPALTKGFVTPSDPEERDPYPLAKPNGPYDR